MKKNKYNIQFRIPKYIHEEMLKDLNREHDFAYERVGFLFTKIAYLSAQDVLIVATEYNEVQDDHYVRDKSVGAKINSTAIRNAMQGVLDKDVGCFHVHLHNHSGKPYPSFTDSESLPEISNIFLNIAPKQANGFLILSDDGFYSEIKIGNKDLIYEVNAYSVIGYPFKFQYKRNVSVKKSIYDRQSFLGENSHFIFENIKVGIIGYGGGGSHIGQQMAHIGVKNVTVFDDDSIEDTNLNRLIGGVFADIKKAVLKIDIARRVIKKILPSAIVITIDKKWQKAPKQLQNCDVIFGCVDSYTERQQLEAECRRFLIPLIDIGMDIYKAENYSMSGQIILSMPGKPCMTCYGFLTEDKLSKEAAKYGNVGGRPQVVWPNGSIASTAVGLFVELVTGWTGESDKNIYLAYDGNTGKIEDHIRKQFSPAICKHYPLSEAGTMTYCKL